MLATARYRPRGWHRSLQPSLCDRHPAVGKRAKRAGCSRHIFFGRGCGCRQDAGFASVTAVHGVASKWDNVPGLYSNEDAFSEPTYWDRRFESERTFEWYRSYSSLRAIICKHLPLTCPILHVGVGSSTMQVDMAQEGYKSIMNVDFSSVAVQRATKRDANVAALRYGVADVRSMPQFEDASFQGILDKGLLDALLCGDDAEGDAAKVLGEVWRLLQPGAGVYIMVTSGSPRSRLPYLQRPETPWSALCVYEVGQQQALEGPYDCGAGTPAEAVLELPRMAYSHMVYVCSR